VVREGQSEQYQVSRIPLNKMREKEETIRAVVDSRVATDGEATVYTSARFRYLTYLLQVLPMVITV
jgi:hypothetical protein